jgi:CRISPR type I-E-associated protein CasB/Cse2
MAAEEGNATAAVLQWWRSLQSDSGASRASAARLRRCANIFHALLLPETHDLIKAVRRSGDARLANDVDRRLAVLAMALAHVDKSSTTPFAEVLGKTAGDGDRPRLSPARFGALMRAAHARDWDDFARALRRAFAILGDSRFDVPRFVGDVLHMGDHALQRWTYQYWQTTAPSEPDEQSQSPNDTETIQ